MCILLIGDSNTKCTLLGGAHSMVCDFETNMFASLSDVVRRQRAPKWLSHFENVVYLYMNQQLYKCD
jgi:hypothetical protein